MTNPNSRRGAVILKLAKHPVLNGFLALLFCTAAIITYLLHHQMMDNARTSLAASLATEYATKQRILVDHHIDQRAQQLLALAQDDLFIEALATADQTMLSRMEQRMKDLIADLNNGYLLRPGEGRLAELNNFIGQQLSRQVLEGELPEPVAAKIRDDWELVFAYPVKNTEGKILGTLLAMLSMEPLNKALARAVDPSLGTTELLQDVPGARATPFLTLTNKSRAVNTVKQDTRIGTWKLHFTGSATLLKRAAPSYTEFMMLAGAVASITLLLAYLAIRIALHRDHWQNWQGRRKPTCQRSGIVC